jgi:hypothetical protein
MAGSFGGYGSGITSEQGSIEFRAKITRANRGASASNGHVLAPLLRTIQMHRLYLWGDAHFGHPSAFLGRSIIWR